ncbi:MAG: DUF333 domain-containing protein, partial [Anaerolineae bacterium]|nr:DUF333 domain-containing protein [Anaerolineae bacterium]
MGQEIVNPASEYCLQQGGTLDIRTEAGGEVGYCQFADGSECEEWAFMRGECQPGQPAAEVALPEPSEDIIARAAKLKPLDMSQSALLSGLAGWELAVLD